MDKSINWDRALTAALASKWAYEDGKTAKPVYKEMGFTAHKFLDKDGAQAHLCNNKETAMIVCRGTEPKQISDFRGWVIATDQMHLDEIKQTFETNSIEPLMLRFNDGRLTIESNGNSKAASDTNFELKLLEKVTSETRTKIERITRILKRAAQGKVSERLEKSLVDLNQEEDRVRQSLYKEHVQAFVEAAWRVMIILMRLRLLEGRNPNF